MARMPRGRTLEKYIYKVDASGKKTKLSTEKGYNEAVFSNGCQYYLNTYSNLTTPPVYTLCNAAGKTLQTVEDNGQLKEMLAALPLGTPEIISVNTADGIQLNGWMVKPKNFDASKKYPVLMYQYGGPGNSVWRRKGISLSVSMDVAREAEAMSLRSAHT